MVREPVEGEAVGAWGRGGVGSVCKGGVRRGRDSFFFDLGGQGEGVVERGLGRRVVGDG